MQFMDMKSGFIRVLMLLMVYLSTTLGGYAQRDGGVVSIKATLDSATLLMGNMSLIHLQIVQDANDMGVLLISKSKLMTDTIELSEGFAPSDTIRISDARIQIDKSLYVQSFDSGLYQIPPFMYVVGNDTFASNDLVLKVIPVNVDSLTTVHDFKGVRAAEFNLFDFFPSIYKYWYIYIVILLILVVGLWLYLRKRIVSIAEAKENVVIPPYEEAIINLNALKEQQLWQSGREKEYYTILTDILRNYLERRFGIYAMEMTSSQIIRIIKENEQTKEFNKNMKQILEIADYVKFAKVRPMPEDNERAFRNAIDFVEDTKPKVVEVEDKSVDEGATAENDNVATN